MVGTRIGGMFIQEYARAKYWIKRPPIPVCTIPATPVRAIPLELK